MTFKEYSKGIGNTDTFEFENANPDNLCTGDCSTRAIVGALGVSYNDAIDLQCAEAKRAHYGLTSNEVLIAILEAHGFTGHKMGAVAKGKKRATVGDVAKLHADKTCVIRAARHFTVSRGGVVFDIWNCTKKTAFGVWYK